LLINSGFNLKEIQEWLGRSSIATTVNIPYGHTNQSSYISISKALPLDLKGNAFSSGLGHPTSGFEGENTF